MARQRQKRDKALYESDLELTRAAAQGDAEARRLLVERLLNRIGVTVRCLAAGDPDTDDYVQLALIEILQSVGSFRGESSIEAWAERIAIRTAMRQIKVRRWRATIVTLDTAQEGPSKDPSSEDEIVRHRISERITYLLETLSPERRLVVTMRLLLGHSIAEISEITNMKFNTVRDRLRVGRKQLRGKILRDPVLKELV